jgi:hypothetical protein
VGRGKPGVRRKPTGESGLERSGAERTEGRWEKKFFNNSIVQAVVVVVVVVDVGPESSQIIFFNSTVQVIVC